VKCREQRKSQNFSLSSAELVLNHKCGINFQNNSSRFDYSLWKVCSETHGSQGLQETCTHTIILYLPRISPVWEAKLVCPLHSQWGIVTGILLPSAWVCFLLLAFFNTGGKQKHVRSMVTLCNTTRIFIPHGKEMSGCSDTKNVLPLTLLQYYLQKQAKNPRHNICLLLICALTIIRWAI